MASENTQATPFQTALMILGAVAFFMSLVLKIVSPLLLLGVAAAFWGLLMLVLVTALATELYLAIRASKKFAPNWKNVALFPFAAWMVAAPLAGAVAIFSAGMAMLYVWARAPQTSELLVLWLSVPATLLVGGAAFLFRLRLRCLYGITEVGAGLFVAWFQVRGGGSGSGSGNLLSGTFLLAFITAAVYLVVRGLDNVHQGWEAEPPDPFASFLKTRLVPRLQKEPNSSVQQEGLKPS